MSRESHIQAVAKYQDKKDKVVIYLDKGVKSMWQKEAADRGMSMTALIKKAVDAYICDIQQTDESPKETDATPPKNGRIKLSVRTTDEAISGGAHGKIITVDSESDVPEEQIQLIPKEVREAKLMEEARKRQTKRSNYLASLLAESGIHKTM